MVKAQTVDVLNLLQMTLNIPPEEKNISDLLNKMVHFFYNIVKPNAVKRFEF